MVRALLEGRKTQTRRMAWRDSVWADEPTHVPTLWPKCKPGDRLYVRETFGVWHRGDSTHVRGQPYDPVTVYRADDEDPDIPHDFLWEPFRWRPSIHMPRKLSRLTLVVTKVRQQPLHKISEKDCKAEGTPRPMLNNWMDDVKWKSAFKMVWIAIHGPDAWDENPDIVALTFTVHQTNIDQMENAP